MKHLIANSVLLVILTIGAQAESGKEKKTEREKRPRGAEFAAQFFARLDQDKDGSISQEEFAANPRLKKASPEQRIKLFGRLDKNGDGLIRQNELKPPKGMGRGERRGHPRWLENGPVDYETFSKQPRIQKLQESVRRRLFDRMDRNGDGILSKEDSPRQRGKRENNKRGKAPSSQGNPDANSDGKISFVEFQNIPRHQGLTEDEVEDRFEKLDKNSDGFLNEEEFKHKHK